MDNLFRGELARRPEELVEVLVRAGRVRLERIVSTGHATPPGQWLVQDQEEWARRHRVEWADLDGPTV